MEIQDWKKEDLIKMDKKKKTLYQGYQSKLRKDLGSSSQTGANICFH